MQFTVAIDGPAAAGKGTISKAVAEYFGFSYLDTGMLYRAVGLKVLNGADATLAAQKLQPADLCNGDLRTPEVAQAASRVAALPDIRAALLDFQRTFARTEGGAVLDGRDIGTVICPNAEVKLYVTASDTVRAKRRYAELTQKGHDTTEAKVMNDLQARDARDAKRDAAPLKPAEDAVLLDTTTLSIEEAIATATQIISGKLQETAAQN